MLLEPPGPAPRVACRREALTEFHFKTVDEVIASVQDLWHYGTVKWLSLHVPTRDRRRRRWPLDPAWEEVRAVRITMRCSCG